MPLPVQPRSTLPRGPLRRRHRRQINGPSRSNQRQRRRRQHQRQLHLHRQHPLHPLPHRALLRPIFVGVFTAPHEFERRRLHRKNCVKNLYSRYPDFIRYRNYRERSESQRAPARATASQPRTPAQQ